MLTFEHSHLNSLTDLLIDHPLMTSIETKDDLGIFAQQFVFAEWSTMTLLKALQKEFTNSELMWFPTDDPMSRKLINELVLQYESSPEVGGLSQLEWYIQSMQDCSFDTAYIECMLDNIKQYNNYASIIDSLDFSTQRYVHNVVQIALSEKVLDIASAFFMGRWIITPKIAKKLLFGLSNPVLEREKSFKYYWEVQARPVDEEQKVIAINLLTRLCNNNSGNAARCVHVAAKMLELMHMLWDGMYYQIIEKSSSKQFLSGV